MIILATILFVGLTYVGKSFFSMDHGMTMGSIECVNHCIDTSVFPVIVSSALPILLFVLCWFVLLVTQERFASSLVASLTHYARLTEPIRLFLQKQTVSSVIIRD